MTAFHPVRRFGSEFSIAGVDPLRKFDLPLLCAKLDSFRIDIDRNRNRDLTLSVN